MNSVGNAWAILKDRQGGDKEEAKNFLLSMSPEQRAARNATEIRPRGIGRRKFKMGSKY